MIVVVGVVSRGVVVARLLLHPVLVLSMLRVTFPLLLRLLTLLLFVLSVVLIPLASLVLLMMICVVVVVCVV